MKCLPLVILPLLFLAPSLVAMAAATKSTQSIENLKPFPQAGEGYERFVFHVPERSAEEDCLVSLIIGKTVKTDPVNRMGLAGTIEAQTISGWGYTYYKVESEGQLFGTLMAPPPEAKKVERFVEIRSKLGPIRYNSKLPYVVIVPKGFKVKYRIWNAGEIEVAEKE